jgi:uncharacterized protein (DUF305 family)
MQKQTRAKTGLIILGLVAITAAGSLLTACNANTQTQGSLPTSTSSGTPASTPVLGIDHGTMPNQPGHEMGHGMDLGPADANFDLRFIDGMIPHHEGAVVMARDVLQKSKRLELRQLATAIISAQQKEIAQMKRWRQQWYAKMPATPMAWHDQMGHMMEMSQQQRRSMMMTMDLGAADANFDLRFLNAMIPHHEGALTMAKSAKQNSQRAEMQRLAQDILSSQQAEINQMKKWRKAWYNQ